jgi:hypothetical protein
MRANEGTIRTQFVVPGRKIGKWKDKSLIGHGFTVIQQWVKNTTNIKAISQNLDIVYISEIGTYVLTNKKWYVYVAAIDTPMLNQSKK